MQLKKVPYIAEALASSRHSCHPFVHYEVPEIIGRPITVWLRELNIFDAVRTLYMH